MRQTAVRESSLLKKRIQSKAHVDAKNMEIMITLNRKPSPTRQNFVIDALETAGEVGLFVNQLLRGWNVLCDKLNKPRSNYAAFRKLIWVMNKKKIIERVPEFEIPPEDLKGNAPWNRSFYRLTRKYLESRYQPGAKC